MSDFDFDARITPDQTDPALQALQDQALAALRMIYDPEIPVNIVELGLIYELEVFPDRNARVEMTLTAPNCPVAESMPDQVRNMVATVPGIEEVKVDLVFTPPWTPERMSEAAKLELNMM